LISSLRNGLDTIIRKNDDHLYGGQALKIALARAFYSDAKILILDESNNSLDTKLEHEILKFIKIKSYDNIVIIISHQSKSPQYLQ